MIVSMDIRGACVGITQQFMPKDALLFGKASL
ncbi:hypothetical protein SAMN05421665_2362 [Yoonia rosea]|uniref:Uncharacterized protein n=1 Tax=Yoonia rosea TaxID=287098 RepID=A0A1R3X8Y9_9RHOB|nr:hypothetical protein SAMN05421665_2362 [Yoonia rosea]